MSRLVALVANDNGLILPGLKHSITGEWITSGATVSCTVKNAYGDTVEGAEDISLIYTPPDEIDADLLAELAEDGNYIGMLPYTLPLQHLATYIGLLTAIGGGVPRGQWELPIIARKRT